MQGLACIYSALGILASRNSQQKYTSGLYVVHGPRTRATWACIPRDDDGATVNVSKYAALHSFLGTDSAPCLGLGIT